MKNILLFDIINLIPHEADCYIAAPSMDDKITLKLMEQSEFVYYKIIKLTSRNRRILLKRFREIHVYEEFQSIEIKLEGKLLFDGEDGIEYGIISKDIRIPDWFKAKYTERLDYIISSEW